jgi:heat shock protein HslJ
MRRLIPVLVLALSSCAVKAAPEHSLTDTSWRFVKIDEIKAAADTAMLEFRSGSISANVGCNGMGGPWRIEERRLIAGPLVQTEMYCAGPVWTQEEAVSALLAAAPEIKQDGNQLTLHSSGHDAVLERISPHQPAQ